MTTAVELDTRPAPPPLLALSHGPAWLFCLAKVGYAGLCKAGLRPDGTCPEAWKHRHDPWGLYDPKRFDAPPLIYQEPLCPLCEHPVMHDGDGWLCETCDFAWPSEGMNYGQTTREGKYQCTATTDGGRVRCVLTDEDEDPRSHEIRRRELKYRDGRIVLENGRPVWEERLVARSHRGVPVGDDGHPDPYRGLDEGDGHRWPA